MNRSYLNSLKDVLDMEARHHPVTVQLRNYAGVWWLIFNEPMVHYRLVAKSQDIEEIQAYLKLRS